MEDGGQKTNNHESELLSPSSIFDSPSSIFDPLVDSLKGRQWTEATIMKRHLKRTYAGTATAM
jgi:hypothetical protein